MVALGYGRRRYGLGGAIVRVGERVLDGSLRRRMTKLRRQLLSG